MNEYLKRDEVLDKLDAMIAYWETRDDCWVHTLQVARSAIASIEPVKEVADAKLLDAAVEDLYRREGCAGCVYENASEYDRYINCEHLCKRSRMGRL